MQGQNGDPSDVLDEPTRAFYLRAMDVLDRCGVEYMVGGAYAMAYHAGVVRHTKDLDVFLRRDDFPRASRAFDAAGYRTELTHPHWLGKAYNEDDSAFIDMIYGSGNGLCRVDDDWLGHAVDGQVIGRGAKLSPAEEIIWSKSFIMERNRFDGADIAHLLLARGRELDWARLLHRFSRNERVLLAHLVLFGFIYPSEKSVIPSWVMDELFGRVRGETTSGDRVCRGTLLSWEQYLPDLKERGFDDARLQPRGPLTREEVERWTKAGK
jgi:hypothetical protein